LKASDLFSAGRVLEERYRILRLVGRGGSGEVYEAEDLRQGERVAIKTMSSDRVANPQALRRFERERDFSQRISHPNVLKIFELFKVPVEIAHGSRTVTVLAPCMAMELLEGETLADRFQRGETFTAEAAKPLVSQMAAALDAAHRQGIVHRDLKPDNVFLVSDGDATRVVVTDFGVARQAKKRRTDKDDSMTRSDVILGTPEYMAPEQLDLEKAMPSSDIYTLGIVMFEMLTGHHPFEADKAIERVFKRLREPAPSPRRFLPAIDPLWEATILRCLRRKPENRFATAMGIVRALEGKGSEAVDGSASGDDRGGHLRTLAVVAAVVVLAVVILVLLACGGGGAPSRVLVLGLDGLDPQTVDLLMSEGKLPNFARLRQEGAYGRLLSQKPLLSPIIWTTIATGKGPEEHGIGHFVAQASDTGEQIPASSDLRRVKALWNIASGAGKKVATVGWWATWPPEEVDGAVVSDHTAYHFLFEDGLTGGDGARQTYPAALAERIAPLLRRPHDVGYEELERFVDVEPEELDRPFDFDDDLAHFRWALATALSYRDIGLELWRRDRPDLAMIYVEGTDSTSHLFGHLFRAQGLGGELAEQQRRFGHTVEEMYLFADEILGEILAAMDDRTTLVVLSDHGFELGALHGDPTRTRSMRRVSERFHRIEGILYLYGHRVKEHARIDRPSILDVAPTVLALLGVPPARDRPGGVINEAYTAELGADRIATYEGGAGGSEAGAVELDPVRQAQLEHLKSLGYLGGSGEAGEAGEEFHAAQTPEALRNLAAINFQAGRYEDSVEIYRRLVEADPQDAALRASLAGALGALERYDQALEQLAQAIEIEPLNVEAYHNRAVIEERQGKIDLAVADYRTALRYQPSYEPSQRALYRLTGQANVHLPANAAEARASELVEQASGAARRANYEEAIRLLDEAERVAPRFVLIYQYRSNVAYLMGDQEGAIAALERGLEIEPDNALFKTNLERLRSGGGG
jgi:tetratricopeptide (TPR) repeat protein